MDELQITVYLPTVEYRNSCDRDGNRVFIGWYLPSLQSIVAVVSYPSYQRSDVAKVLQELGSMPQLQRVFRRHGNLSLLKGFSLKSDDKGHIMTREDGTQTYVQLVKYAIENFRAVSFDELSSLGSMADHTKECSDVHAPRQVHLSSYFIMGAALIGHIDEQLVAKTADSHGDKHTAHLREQYQRRRNSIFKYIEATVYMWLVHLAFRVSYCAKLLVSAASLIRSNLLKSWLHKVELVNVLCDRVSQVSQWRDSYVGLQRHTDIVEYVCVRHKIRQSVVSCVMDVCMGVLQFFLLRRTVVYSVNKLRLVLRTFYVSTLKYMTYQFTMRIGKYCKVNNEVAVFLSRLLMSKIIVWRLVKPQIQKYFFIASKVFQFSAMLGVTCQIAVLIDIMTIETLHIAYAHCILLYITRWTQHYLYSLLQLFKGKKWNELKQALDSNDYTREQLFLGTVIFTLLLLIYPTIWIFYSVTLVVYLPIVVAKAVLKGINEIISKIPSYFIAYNVIFPDRYKEHIYFDYDSEACVRDLQSAKIGSQEKNNNAEKGKRRPPPWRLLEVRCSRFSTNNALKPVISGLKSCARSTYFGKIV